MLVSSAKVATLFAEERRMTTYGRAIVAKPSDPQKARRRMRVGTNNGEQTFVVHPNWRTVKMAHFRKFPKQRDHW
jgi:hypothetical protein